MMYKKTAVKYITDSVTTKSVFIYCGKYINHDIQSNNNLNIHITNYINYLSFSAGVAMSFSGKVYCFIDADDLFCELNSILDIVINKLNNLFIITFYSESDRDCVNMDNMLNRVNSMKGVLFNIGIGVFDITKYTDNKWISTMKASVNDIKGPAVFFVTVKQNKQQCVNVYTENNYNLFMNGFLNIN